ncbi:MAG: hypothetical protein U0360_05140 [Dehalococcoidia bacterium]
MTNSPGLDPTQPDAPPVEAAAPIERSPLAPASSRYVTTLPALLLAVVATGFILMFTLIEPSPRWLVLLGTIATTFGLDGVLRGGRRAAFAEGGLDTAPLLLVPALYMLAVPVFIEYATLRVRHANRRRTRGRGVRRSSSVGCRRCRSSSRSPPGATDHRGRDLPRGVEVFGLVFLFGYVGQQSAGLAVGLAAMLLSADLREEGKWTPVRHCSLASVTGLVVAETRWVIHYLPIVRAWGALALLLAFYLVTGVLHSPRGAPADARGLDDVPPRVGIAGACIRPSPSPGRSSS